MTQSPYQHWKEGVMYGKLAAVQLLDMPLPLLNLIHEMTGEMIEGPYLQSLSSDRQLAFEEGIREFVLLATRPHWYGINR